MTGVAFATSINTSLLAALSFDASAVVKSTCSVCPDPALKIVPAVGVYRNAPATFAVAFNCAALSAVPYTIAVGMVHVSVGVAGVTMSDTAVVAGLSFESAGVNVTDSVWV